MFYLIRRDKSKKLDGIKETYYIFESRTESCMIVTKKLLIKLLEKFKNDMVNVYLDNGEVRVKQWPNEIQNLVELGTHIGSELILLTKESEQRFKLVTCNGNVQHSDSEGLKRWIWEHRIANCDFEKSKDNIVYKSIDTYNSSVNPLFRKKIDLKYSEFRAKVLLTGLDIRFDYEIEDKDVKLVAYTGTSHKVILPNFITTIARAALANGNIHELKLNEGLEYIGSKAFSYNHIENVVIPKSVKFIGDDAFKYNGQLMGADHKYDMSKIKLLNSETMIMEG